MHPQHRHPELIPDTRRERGSVLVLFLVSLIPLLLLASAASTLTSTRNSRLLASIQDHRGLLAVESGLDEVLYQARSGTLDPTTPFSMTVAGGTDFTVDPVELGSDGVDNDGDTQVDEADEAILQVTITGTSARALRRVVAYLGQSTSVIPDLEAAVTVFADTDVAQSYVAAMDGVDRLLDGSPGDPVANVMGLAVVPPATPATVQSLLSQSGSSAIRGTGTNPDIGVGTWFDLGALVTWLQANADVTLTGDVSGAFYGDASVGDYRIVYADQNTNFSGTSGGAGILAVNGKLGFSGSFRWDGLVVVLGEFSGSGDAKVVGAMIQGPAGTKIAMSGSDAVEFSREALQFAGAGTGSGGAYTELLGWHETSRL